MNFRKTAPPIREIENIALQQPVVHRLSNGIPVHEINTGTQDILKLDILFNAGRWHENLRLTAKCTARMLKEGTTTKASSEIAENFDFYAGTFRTSGSLDYTSITLFCLTKHFEPLVKQVHEIMTKPVFPDNEFQEYKQATKQQLLVEQQKVDIMAYREITAMMYGYEHPYGYNSTPEDYDRLKTNHLKAFHQKHFHSANCQIILSGKTNPAMIAKLDELVGNQFPEGKNGHYDHQISEHPDKFKEFRVKGQSMQTAIRIGRRMVPRKHPDYHGLFVLNALLGGYFGSRLMNNIREDKGYTYGIHSTIDSMRHGSYFYIGTETGNEVAELTRKEIYKELKILREELVNEEELTRVRNYLLGNILTSLDGPFNVAALNKMLVLEGLDISYIDKLVGIIKTITPTEIRVLANKYFQPDDLLEVHVK